MLGELNRLPVSNDSLGVRRKRADLEEKLKELELLIDTFTPERVYIPDDQEL